MSSPPVLEHPKGRFPSLLTQTESAPYPARKRPDGVGPSRAPTGPESPTLAALKALRRTDGRQGLPWAPAIGGVAAATGRFPRSGPGTQPPTGAGFAPHSPCARAPHNGDCQPPAKCVSASIWTTTPRDPRGAAHSTLRAADILAANSGR